MEAPAENPAASRPSVPRWQRDIAFLGVGIWFVALVGLLFLFFQDRQQAVACALAVVTFYYAGQFGAMPLGLAAGGEPVLVAVYVWAADAAGLFVFFPITQYGVDRFREHPNFVGRWIKGMHKRAEHRRVFVQRYGPWGLFGFTLLPFLFNSPILGAVLGRIVGLDSRRTFVALASAVTLMSVIWIAIFAYSLEVAAGVDERLPWVLGLASVGITVFLAALAATVRAVKNRAAARTYSK